MSVELERDGARRTVLPELERDGASRTVESLVEPDRDGARRVVSVALERDGASRTLSVGARGLVRCEGTSRRGAGVTTVPELPRPGLTLGLEERGAETLGDERGAE